ncbi:MAG: hypothetical protein C4345_00750 [Chloroflexota bacterium]
MQQAAALHAAGISCLACSLARRTDACSTPQPVAIIAQLGPTAYLLPGGGTAVQPVVAKPSGHNASAGAHTVAIRDPAKRHHCITAHSAAR